MNSPDPHDGIWRDFNVTAKQLDSLLRKGSAMHVNSAKELDAVRNFVQKYFRELRPILSQRKIDVSGMDNNFEVLKELSSGRSLRSLYVNSLKTIQKNFSELELQNEYYIGTGSVLVLSKIEEKILDTLIKIDQNIANSYLQILNDLGDQKRISYKGTAHELREVLREVLQKLAPDEEVQKMPGFVFEKNTTKPTMKQKVFFIFSTRGKNDEETKIVEKSIALLEKAEDIVGDVARGIYSSGSQAAHTVAFKKNTILLKGYLDAVLCDLLELI